VDLSSYAAADAAVFHSFAMLRSMLSKCAIPGFGLIETGHGCTRITAGGKLAAVDQAQCRRASLYTKSSENCC
jgi:hypothetical protein